MTAKPGLKTAIDTLLADGPCPSEPCEKPCEYGLKDYIIPLRALRHLPHIAREPHGAAWASETFYNVCVVSANTGAWFYGLYLLADRLAK